ncbi:MAG: metallophosphoesterase [Halanaeroarchaeum sp.]
MPIDSFQLRDRALYFPGSDVLILADLHLGMDQTSDLELPVGERADVLDRIDELLAEFEPGTVIVAGDVVHAFDHVPDAVGLTWAAMTDRIRAAEADFVVLRGNHDAVLDQLRSGPIDAHYRIAGDEVVAHGHEPPAETAPQYVIGHEHPAIRIEGERHACALDCIDQRDAARVIVAPAFTRLARGTLVNGRRSDESVSPLLSDVTACRPVVETEDDTLRFPPLSSFRSLL